MNPVKKLRTLSGLTEEDFCEEIEIGRSYLSRLENNRHDVGLLKFLSWCKILEVNPSDTFK